MKNDSDRYRIASFPPIASACATVLILGSMPGAASLHAGQYYAHERNAFWPIICEWLGIPHATPYESRVRAVSEARLAVWDVLASCIRHGSADAEIDPNTMAAHDFNAFFDVHCDIRHVCFNGSKAADCFRKLILPTLNCPTFEFQRLPSTSPAYAAMPFTRKRDLWHAILSKTAGNPAILSKTAGNPAITPSRSW
jgi:hypoxanthine-DNA glycosylase